MQSRSAGALRAYFMNIFWNNWSGRQDSNLLPPHPQCEIDSYPDIPSDYDWSKNALKTSISNDACILRYLDVPLM